MLLRHLGLHVLETERLSVLERGMRMRGDQSFWPRLLTPDHARFIQRFRG